MSANEVPVVDFATFAAVVAEGFALPVELFDADARLVDDIGFDSLMFVELAEMLSDAAGHWVADEAVASLVTVGDVYRFWLATPAARPPTRAAQQ